MEPSTPLRRTIAPDEDGPDATPVAVLRLLDDLTGRGQDAGGGVTVELAGTGRPRHVEVTSLAMNGDRESMARAVEQALDAAWHDLEARRREAGPQLRAAARSSLARAGEEAGRFQQAATQQLERTLAAVSAAAASAAETTS